MTAANNESERIEFVVFPGMPRLAQVAAERFVKLAHKAIVAHQRFLVALSGGSTPKPLYELLATKVFAEKIDWTRVQVFFTDERSVAPDHPDSNYRMARLALFEKVPIPPANVYRIRGELPPSAAAKMYQDELRDVLGENGRFDLILLGMGTDGHTASLFPGSEALEERDQDVVATYVEASHTWRITLTLPVINEALHILFLVSGSEKAPALSCVLSGEPLPAGRIKPNSGALEWYVDQGAAACLDL
jgi:6-phosphogluconolactonase